MEDRASLLLRMAGATMTEVAGAGFEPATFGLWGEIRPTHGPKRPNRNQQRRRLTMWRGRPVLVRFGPFTS